MLYSESDNVGIVGKFSPQEISTLRHKLTRNLGQSPTWVRPAP